MAHITGGGITGKLPRALHSDVQAVMELDRGPCCQFSVTWRRSGKIDREELLQTFNMGVGMILVVPAKNIARVETELKRRREKFYRSGGSKAPCAASPASIIPATRRQLPVSKLGLWPLFGKFKSRWPPTVWPS